MENIWIYKENGIVPGKLPNGYVPMDMDVTPFDNSKTKKQGVSRTYKGYDGYAPIMAYIGTEGYLVNCELREGKTVYIGSDWKPVSYQTEDGSGKNITLRTGYEIINRTIDKYGQFLWEGDIEVNT